MTNFAFYAEPAEIAAETATLTIGLGEVDDTEYIAVAITDDNSTSAIHLNAADAATLVELLRDLTTNLDADSHSAHTTSEKESDMTTTNDTNAIAQWTDVPDLSERNRDDLKRFEAGGESSENLLAMAQWWAESNRHNADLTAQFDSAAFDLDVVAWGDWYEPDDHHPSAFRTATVTAELLCSSEPEAFKDSPIAGTRVPGVLHAEVSVDVMIDGTSGRPFIVIDTEGSPLAITADQARKVGAEFTRLADDLDALNASLATRAA